jgi:nitrite reductase/ring-hydroxylating ferredoxin subunit
VTTPVPTGLSRDDLTDGYATPAEIGGAKILLIRLGAEIRAVSAWCPHQRTLIGAQQIEPDGLLECPLHGAVFDTADGSLQLGPTCDAIPAYRVEVDRNGAIAVAVTAGAGGPAAPRTSSFGAWGRTQDIERNRA